MGKRVTAVKAGESDVWGTSWDHEGRVILNNDETETSRIELPIFVEFSEKDNGSFEENLRIDSAMTWDLTITNKRLIFWSPEVMKILGGCKRVAGKATTGYVDLSEINVVELSNTLSGASISITARDIYGFRLMRITAPKDDLTAINTLVSKAWSNELGAKEESKNQVQVWLDNCWEYIGVPGSVNQLVRAAENESRLYYCNPLYYLKQLDALIISGQSEEQAARVLATQDYLREVMAYVFSGDYTDHFEIKERFAQISALIGAG